MNTIAALLTAATLLGASAAFEHNLEEEHQQRRLKMGGGKVFGGSTFEKYIGIYDRCCAPEFVPHGPRGDCKCWVRTADWRFYSPYDKWEAKCPTTITAKSSIVQLASETASLSTLVSLLTKYPDLVEALSGPGTFTVFAPTDDAFAALFQVVDPDDLSEAQVKKVLMTHVLGDVVKAGDLVDDAVVPTLAEGESLTVNLDGMDAFVTAGGNSDDVQIIATDLHTSNGVVHLVSDVLIPDNLGER